MKKVFVLLIVTTLAFFGGIIAGNKIVDYIFAEGGYIVRENNENSNQVTTSTKDDKTQNTYDKNNHENHENAKDKNQSEFIFADSNTKLLTEAEIQKLSKEDSVKALNEIFARYGHEFSTASLRDYFSEKDWYESISGKKVSVSELNDIEQKNVIMLDNYIKKF